MLIEKVVTYRCRCITVGVIREQSSMTEVNTYDGGKCYNSGAVGRSALVMIVSRMGFPLFVYPSTPMTAHCTPSGLFVPAPMSLVLESLETARRMFTLRQRQISSIAYYRDLRKSSRVRASCTPNAPTGASVT